MARNAAWEKPTPESQRDGDSITVWKSQVSEAENGRSTLTAHIKEGDNPSVKATIDVPAANVEAAGSKGQFAKVTLGDANYKVTTEAGTKDMNGKDVVNGIVDALVSYSKERQAERDAKSAEASQPAAEEMKLGRGGLPAPEQLKGKDYMIDHASSVSVDKEAGTATYSAHMKGFEGGKASVEVPLDRVTDTPNGKKQINFGNDTFEVKGQDGTSKMMTGPEISTAVAEAKMEYAAQSRASREAAAEADKAVHKINIGFDVAKHNPIENPHMEGKTKLVDLSGRTFGDGNKYTVKNVDMADFARAGKTEPGKERRALSIHDNRTYDVVNEKTGESHTMKGSDLHTAMKFGQDYDKAPRNNKPVPVPPAFEDGPAAKTSSVKAAAVAEAAKAAPKAEPKAESKAKEMDNEAAF